MDENKKTRSCEGFGLCVSVLGTEKRRQNRAKRGSWTWGTYQNKD